ncbi:MAG: S8 family peptidase [Burkholderiales bacterium]
MKTPEARRRTGIAVLLLTCALPLVAAPFLDTRGTWGQAYDDLWGLKRIGLGATPPSAPAGAPVIVAVIDSGLDYFHPDLRGDSVWRNPKEIVNGKDDDGNGYVDDVIGWDFADNDNDPFDFTGHGTFVAGVIVASPLNGAGVLGVNPNVQIMPLRVMNSIGRNYPTRTAAAIYYAVQNGARIINLSLASQQLSASEKRAVDYAASKGVLVIAAAGNDGRDVKDYSPASLENVLTVAATDPQDRRAGFSNFGGAIDIAAPGVDILSLRARQTDFMLFAGVKGYKPGANFVGAPENRYYRADGTSFAAPFVTGVASLVLAARPTLTAAEVRRMLLQSARDIDQPGVDGNTGYGLLDAKAALAADPAFFVEAGITALGVVRKDDGQYVRVSGTAAADRFKEAVVEIGEGENPGVWQKVGTTLQAPVSAGILAEIPASTFRTAKIWTVRVVSEHTNGRKREGRFVLKLG